MSETAEGRPVEETGAVGRHLGDLVSRDLVNRIARFGAAVLLARALTLEEYGIVNVGIAAAGIAITATTLGLNDLGARAVAARPDSVVARSTLAGEVLAARMTFLGAVCLIAIAVTAIVSPASLAVAGVTAAIAMTMAASADWILRGLERMAAFGTEVAMGGLTVLVGAAFLTFVSGNAITGLTVILAGEIVSTTLSWAWAGTTPRLRLNIGRLRSLLRRSWPLAISSLAMYVYFANLDTILLAAMRSAEEAGLYSAPYRVFLALNAISFYTAYSYLPMLTRGVEAGDHGPAFEALRRGVRYLIGYGAFLLGGAQLLGGDALSLLFGSDFSGMGPTFVVLCLAIIWFSFGYPIGYGLIARHQNRRFMLGAASGAVLNLVLNLILIPPFGVIGAAVATAAAVVAACLTWLWGQRILGRETAPELVAMTTLTLAAVAGLIDDRFRIPAILCAVLVGVVTIWPLVSELLAPSRER